MPKSSLLLLLVLLPCLAGCPVFQSQDTPVDQFKVTNPADDAKYWLYVPSYYSPDKGCWPLVITLHGTFGFDSSSAQIREWKALAEQEGFIVAAPKMRSVQGLLPTVRAWWRKDLLADEQTILNCLDYMQAKYPNIDSRAILLTGFSAGGYPLYFTGLRNPERFSGMVARGCNSCPDLFKRVAVTPELQNMPIIILHGKDDFGRISAESWAAFRWLRERKCFETTRHKIIGGHIRQPELAWRYWRKHLPRELLDARRDQ